MSAERETAAALETDALPGAWTVRELDLTGSFKIRATCELVDDAGELEAVLEVRPFKSYDDVPGFPDCHEVELRDHTAREPPAVETFGGSPSATEYLDDTVDLAVEVMTDFLEADE